jgi:hypothetical protein
VFFGDGDRGPPSSVTSTPRHRSTAFVGGGLNTPIPVPLPVPLTTPVTDGTVTSDVGTRVRERASARRATREEDQRRLDRDNSEERVLLHVIRAEARYKEEKRLDAKRSTRRQLLESTAHTVLQEGLMSPLPSAATPGPAESVFTFGDDAVRMIDGGDESHADSSDSSSVYDVYEGPGDSLSDGDSDSSGGARRRRPAYRASADGDGGPRFSFVSTPLRTGTTPTSRRGASVSTGAGDVAASPFSPRHRRAHKERCASIDVVASLACTPLLLPRPASAVSGTTPRDVTGGGGGTVAAPWQFTPPTASLATPVVLPSELQLPQSAVGGGAGRDDESTSASLSRPAHPPHRVASFPVRSWQSVPLLSSEVETAVRRVVVVFHAALVLAFHASLVLALHDVPVRRVTEMLCCCDAGVGRGAASGSRRHQR